MIYDLMLFNIVFLFNSPYSFDFSPIEEFFGIIKQKIKFKNMDNSNKLMNVIMEEILKVENTLIKKLFIRSFIYM